MEKGGVSYVVLEARTPTLRLLHEENGESYICREERIGADLYHLVKSQWQNLLELYYYRHGCAKEKEKKHTPHLE